MNQKELLTHWVACNIPVEGGRTIPTGNASHLSFNGQVLMSYRTPIACYHPSPSSLFNPPENGFWLITSEKIESPWHTTYKHINMAMRAVSLPRFVVPYVGATGSRAHTLTADEHLGNFSWMMHLIHGMASQSIKHFKVREEEYRYSSASYWATAIENQYRIILNYQTATGATYDELPELASILSKVNAERERKWFLWTDPKAMARRERAYWRKEAIKALNLKGEDE